ncbi:acetyl-CoA carboxylase biotin carboxylase subunit [Bacillus timonensis]|nr:acetyl-CoA carboxylase biotin carboxylase subunit [Bacillus timonensis]
MKKILIANRGEIASRIIKTCNEMNIETVAIYSDADKDLPYVKQATKAYRVGEPPVVKSYLQLDKILEIAVDEKVDAIHPGYGFLSENTAFAKAANEKGIKFIGPRSDVISLMGDKVIARNTMIEAGVPVVPGSDQGVDSIEEACELAKDMGYPVMLKASGGGGGIGMQRCDNEEALIKAYQSTKGRAKAYFGNDEVFIEKFISEARHIEVQIFGDESGNIVHLFERDCSIQRRNQKVIEETPSPFISKKTRQDICETAVRAAKHVQYTNAGTIEFIVDENENFYFLEMNTRLQVEHPITEMITNLDLVKWQILVSRGENLPLSQVEITGNGHAIEFRLYAEDPKTFMPSPGKLEVFTYNQNEGVRLDLGFEEKNVVSPFYDPMIGKVIIFGEDREEAIKRSKAFFSSMKIEGIKSNVPLFLSILSEESFKEGKYTTAYLTKTLQNIH